ncbi:MAG: glycosyl hydrolase, repeat-containing protein [Candidatus Solibacter sp.]|nr:glycosyl hydrolase, repeat-containing protein [Candidatus Solibacter sp.]
MNLSSALLISGFLAVTASASNSVSKQFTVASFGDSGQNSIQAIATSSRGDIYIAGTTTSFDISVKNAAQPAFGEARIMRTTDLGVTWTRVGAPPANVIAVVADPVTPQILFAGGDKGIYKSVDSGATWKLVHPFNSIYQFTGALVIDPANHLRLATVEPFTGIVTRSLDGGDTWTTGGQPCSQSFCQGGLVADPAGSGALIVGSFAGLYLSRDWGLTFQPLNPPGFGSPSIAAFAPSKRGWIYAGTSAGVSGSLAMTTDFGATWTAKSSPPNTFSMILNLAVDPDDANALVAGTPDSLYRSTDGAATWVREASSGGPFLTQTHAPFVILPHRCAPAGGLFAQGSAAAGSYSVAYSPDYGATWTTPQLTGLTSVAAGADCAVFITRTASSDAFVAKVAPDGTVLWATYLGGSDQDVPVALAVDNQDNVYIAGTTTSPDFPSTVPRIGVSGQSAAFVSKLSPAGALMYSAIVSGEARNSATALAVDADRNAYVGGGTNSFQFPLTPGTLPVTLAPGSYTGFLVKLSSDASLVYATYLGGSYTYPGAILVDAGGQAIVAGTGLPVADDPFSNFAAFVLRLDRGASQVSAVAYLPGMGTPTSLVADDQGNLFIAGRADRGADFVTPGAYVAPQPLANCPAKFFVGYNAYVSKLAATGWKPVYSALLRSSCGVQTGPIAVDKTGAVVLAISAAGGLPLRNPLVAGPSCGTNTSAVVRLNPSGSALEFATYLDACGVPGIALAGANSLYAGVSPQISAHLAALLHINTASTSTVALDGIANAFSGDSTAIVVGGLYSLTGSGFQAPEIDLGLNPAGDLPLTLGGIEVRFDGVPAPILRTGAGKVIVVPPLPPPLGWRTRAVPGFSAVQLIAHGVASNVVWMPVVDSLPGLLTASFLDPQLPAGSDAYARNQDGTVNDAAHPAPAGSTLTLYVTGMGPAAPPLPPGSIAHSPGTSPVTPVYGSWKRFTPSGQPVPETVFTLPGYLAAVYQMPVVVPSADSLGGVPDANGVRHLVMALQFFIAASSSIPPVSNLVGVYVK